MDKQESIREALVFLDSIRGKYPGGIPKQPAPVPAVETPRRRALIHFIGKVGADARATLQAACTQGLKIKAEEAEISALTAEACASTAALRAFVENRMSEVSCKVVVLLGSQFEAIADAGKEDTTGFRNCNGTPVLISEDAAGITSDPSAKKRFWTALKKVLPLLE